MSRTLAEFEEEEAAALAEEWAHMSSPDEMFYPVVSMRETLLKRVNIDICSEQEGIPAVARAALASARPSAFESAQQNADFDMSAHVIAALTNAWEKFNHHEAMVAAHPHYGMYSRGELIEERNHAKRFVATRAKEIKPPPSAADLEDLERRLFDRFFASAGATDDEIKKAAKSNPALRSVLRAITDAVYELDDDVEVGAPQTPRELEICRQLEVLDVEKLFAFHWPDVLRKWRDHGEERALTQGLYRWPVLATQFNKVIAGKRFGKDHALPVSATEPNRDGIVRITVRAPQGAQLEFGTRAEITAKSSDKDEQGFLKPEAIMRMITEHLGPQVAVMGHVAFALAARHALSEGRIADGRFWVSPSEVGDLLGYTRESDGLTKSGIPRAARISKEATAVIRRNFITYANTIVETRFKLHDGSFHVIKGTLLYPTQKDHTHREHNKKGRDRRVEWRVRDELWDLTRSRFVLMPVELLNAQGERPQVWAECIRLYEVLACHARNNTLAAARGETRATLEWLSTEANLVSRSTKDADGRKRLITLLEKLRERNALSFEMKTLSEGRPGIVYALAQERRAELSKIAERHEQKKLPPKTRKRAEG